MHPKAAELKSKASAEFKKRNMRRALELYVEAFKTTPGSEYSDATLLSNAAICCKMLGLLVEGARFTRVAISILNNSLRAKDAAAEEGKDAHDADDAADDAYMYVCMSRQEMSDII